MSHQTNSKPTAGELLLRDFALTYPETREDFPWGDRALKVGKKAFVFMGTDENGAWGMSVKLPVTGGVALSLPFCTPTGYGLGKSGWVSVRFERAEKNIPIDLLKQFIDESYRAVAPKTLVKRLDAAKASASMATSTRESAVTKKSAAKKKPAAKKVAPMKAAAKKKSAAKKRG